MTVQLLQCVDIKTQSFLWNWLCLLGPVLQGWVWVGVGQEPRKHHRMGTEPMRALSLWTLQPAWNKT